MFFLKRNLPIWERITRIVVGLLIIWAMLSGLTTAGVVSWLALASAATLIFR